ncbi:MAG: hypothetical protein HC800_18585 [Phormidesmis sp. RL_2_1]|nr:hypothetical protein [Phormidesmis sp. RL_2_1]
MIAVFKKRRSEYVQEADNAFLNLWPHRYDYLYAPHPNPGAKPDWHTQASHPLADRLILQGSYLYGVRFGSNTQYGLLDIDAGSPYHPRRDPLALARITAALEPLGLVDHLCITSSDSGGLHLYFPFNEALSSWQLAIALSALLENAGFKIMSGWLEVFPNPKPFTSDGSISLYNGHRLPLQRGSYLLNDGLQPIAATEQSFVRYWHNASARNVINAVILKQIIRQAKRKIYRVTGKAEKFINDLHADIEPGWSGAGQTNFILGRITLRSYIFGHVLYAAAPLTGEALVKDIVRIAKALPGYADFCGHQGDIEDRAWDWAKCIESSHYFHYGNDKPRATGDVLTWNQQQQAQARERIRAAAVALFRSNHWPEGITARFDALCAAGISGSTLYRHQDLWHPLHLAVPQALAASQLAQPVENPPHPPAFQAGVVGASAGGAAPTPFGSSLLAADGCNPLFNGASGSRSALTNGGAEGGGRNTGDASAEYLRSNEAFAPPPGS